MIEGWSAWDAFYMTVITVTTVGYKEVHDLSRAGEVFTVVLLLGGVGAALYTFTLLATVVVEGGLPKRLQRRRHRRMLDTVKDHFIICGYGRIGRIVAARIPAAAGAAGRHRARSASASRRRWTMGRWRWKPMPAGRTC